MIKMSQKIVKIEFVGNKGFADEFLIQTISNALRDAMNLNGMGEGKIADMFNISITDNTFNSNNHTQYCDVCKKMQEFDNDGICEGSPHFKKGRKVGDFSPETFEAEQCETEDDMLENFPSSLDDQVHKGDDL
jgi:hypothetical protein